MAFPGRLGLGIFQSVNRPSHVSENHVNRGTGFWGAAFLARAGRVGAPMAAPHAEVERGPLGASLGTGTARSLSSWWLVSGQLVAFQLGRCGSWSGASVWHAPGQLGGPVGRFSSPLEPWEQRYIRLGHWVEGSVGVVLGGVRSFVPIYIYIYFLPGRRCDVGFGPGTLARTLYK